MALPSYLSSNMNKNTRYKQINMWHTTQNSTYGTLVIPGSSLVHPWVIPWLSLGYLLVIPKSVPRMAPIFLYILELIRTMTFIVGDWLADVFYI